MDRQPPPALAKTFDPAAIEARWYAHWEDNGLFRPDRPDAIPFTLVNPPPNVTGSLHIGHALDNTLQDVVVRYERLRGKDALWVVGTDHAGIATQMVVERQLELSQDKRTNYSREAFVAKVWEWKAESGGTITRQLRRLGCSMDWSREQFTMDPHFSAAVTKVFVDLYNQGLIYRDKRLVNWDPALKTAISDLEVETQDIPGKFWHLTYPLADGSGHVSVATTRPETMLADMAVAVHPTDARYAALVGTKVRLPITGRLIPIVADEHADPELGSGAVKITPGHDFNDFEVGKRAGIRPADMLNMLDGEARVVQTADGLVPDELVGLDRFEARGRVVGMLEAEGLLEKVEDRTIPTPFGDRGGVVIEPWLTDQWYVDAEKLAVAPMQAVRDGRIEIVPRNWEKTWFSWMENIQPWCVSRQLWWGHRIPAWYDDEGRVYVAASEEEAQALAAAKPLVRDPDVLDTWFSSALWPFATLGWPQDLSSPSPGGEGDQPKAGGGVRYNLPPKTNQSVLRAKAMRRSLSPAEAMLWRALKQRPEGLKFHSQHPAGDYTLDFFCPAAGLAIEIDGEAHDRGNGPERDTVRDEQLSRWGVETLRFPAREILGDLDKAVTAIVACARNRIPLHQPAAGPPPWQAGEDTLLARHYPNDLLISGFDILFFWDARMAMMGMHFMGEVPWRRLYLHGLVRAPDGQKMSKSKGNVVDPLGLIDRFGADALRFFMAAMESQGRDIKMDEKRVEGYRNFATKLWNAARFCQSNGIGASQTLAAPPATTAVNRWIVGEVVETLASLDKAMAELRFDAAANAIYRFVWDTFCDWYLELVKPVLSPLPQAGGAGGGSDPSILEAGPTDSPIPNSSRLREGDEAEETRQVAAWVLDQILIMLHPFMPFVTEELWHALADPDRPRPYALIVAGWPEPEASVDSKAKREVEWLIALTRELRAAKAELGIAPGARLDAYLPDAGAETRDLVTRNRAALERLARLAEVRFEAAPGGAAMQVGVGNDNVVVPLDGVIDIAAEQARLAKSRDAALKERDNLAKRLANPAFADKAKPEAVEKARADHAHHAAEAERLTAALARLG